MNKKRSEIILNKIFGMLYYESYINTINDRLTEDLELVEKDINECLEFLEEIPYYEKIENTFAIDYKWNFDYELIGITKNKIDNNSMFNNDRYSLVGFNINSKQFFTTCISRSVYYQYKVNEAKFFESLSKI